MNKKFFIGGLLGLVLLFPFAARAQTLDQVKAQLIQTLLTLIAELQAQLDELIAAQGGAVSTSTTSNLITGTNGVDVYKTDRKIKEVQDAFEDAVDAYADNGGVFDINAINTMAANVFTIVLYGESVSGEVGKTVSISGQSIYGSVTVHFSDDYSLLNQSVNTSGNIVFTVPDIPKGTYDLIVSTNSGVSNSLDLIVK